MLCFALIWIWIWIWIWILGLTCYSTRILPADNRNSIFFGDLMSPEASLRCRMILDWVGSRDGRILGCFGEIPGFEDIFGGLSAVWLVKGWMILKLHISISFSFSFFLIFKWKVNMFMML